MQNINNTICDSYAELFSVFDIKKWTSTSRIAIPAMQRGLVWSPAQIELLWDSLFRGIPIGSFVICKCIKNQLTDKNIDGTEYHLLDGQQRVNAIQLAFDGNVQNPKGALLWLDLQPKLSNNSTRNFLFRVTTPAHPWGYDRNDDADRLRVGPIKTLLQEYGLAPGENGYKRPSPSAIHPAYAEYPIPMHFLWDLYLNAQGKDLLFEIKEQLNTPKYQNFLWAGRIRNAIENKNITNLEAIKFGLDTASSAKIIALKTPDDLLLPSAQEQGDQEEKEDITSIEHLFQRLNRQGTRLDGEELAYSMIKAYWPEVRNGIDNIEKECRLMPASRLVALAIRTILTEINNDENIVPTLTMTQIRKLAKNNENAKSQIIDFINSDGPNSLKSCCRKIDILLGVNGYNALPPDWGLPPVLRSSIAYDLPEAYLLLLLLVRKQQMDETRSKLITGLITLVKWFGGDAIKLTKKIYSIGNNITITGLREIAHDKEIVGIIHTPSELSDFLKLPSGNVEAWRFWTLIQDVDEATQNNKQQQWWSFICNLRSQREILLYAQRAYLRHRFIDFDPSRKDLWEEHNRPWDFDHILARKYAANKKSNNDYLQFCKEWRDSNANMRAWPFEDNRSDQDEIASSKIQSEDVLRDSFVDKTELDGFSKGPTVISCEKDALAFATSCIRRLVRIYKAWYESFGLDILLQDDSSHD